VRAPSPAASASLLHVADSPSFLPDRLHLSPHASSALIARFLLTPSHRPSLLRHASLSPWSQLAFPPSRSTHRFLITASAPRSPCHLLTPARISSLPLRLAPLLPLSFSSLLSTVYSQRSCHCRPLRIIDPRQEARGNQISACLLF
jgi:hypothetical protein